MSKASSPRTRARVAPGVSGGGVFENEGLVDVDPDGACSISGAISSSVGPLGATYA
jgi:hypothetical protein